MVSQTAVDSLDELKDEGLIPSFADVIRLNAMGLKLEATKKRMSTTSLDYLPRAAAIAHGVFFRQPTIGHDIWIDKVKRVIQPKDYQTILAIEAFTLSRDTSDLPCPEDIEAVREAIDAYTPTLADFTRDQIYAAIDYVVSGASPLLCEYPPPMPTDKERINLYDGEDWKECIALGVLHEGHIALWGMSRADMERMTRQQLEEAIRRAYIYHRFDVSDEEKTATEDFYATLAEIKERLIKEREDGKQ